jgi:DNA-directed RNA polymerase subunit N (RpoN/RPB10)
MMACGVGRFEFIQEDLNIPLHGRRSPLRRKASNEGPSSELLSSEGCDRYCSRCTFLLVVDIIATILTLVDIDPTLSQKNGCSYWCP